MQKKIKTIFLGTSEFSLFFLKAIHNAAFLDLIGIITEPDKPSGRGQKIKFSPVKQYALKNKINLYQPENVSDFVFRASDLLPELAVVVAYGQIIPQKIIDMFKYGIINVHPSLLPKYRGPDPLRAPILAGEMETGISIMKIDNLMDHGPILNQIKINIAPNDNLDDLYGKIVKIGPDFLIQTLKLYLENKIQPIGQNHHQATFTKLIKKTDAQINWDWSADKIDRRIKSYCKNPQAYTILPNGKIIKIIKAQLIDNKLKILFVKAAGKNQIMWKDFLNGYKDKLPQNLIDKIIKY